MKFLVTMVLAVVLAVPVAARLFKPWVLHWDDPNPPGFVGSYEVYRLDGTNEVMLATTTTNHWTIQLPPGEHDVAVVAVGTNRLTSEVSESIRLATVLAVVRLRVEQ